jgi:hypothetical protein
VISEGRGVLDEGLIAGLWRMRLPMLLVYLLLGAGVVVVPRLARGLAGLVLRTAKVPTNLDWLVGSFSYVVAGWLALEGWAASVPLLLRPYFTWKGGLVNDIPPASATVPIQHFRREIVAAAVVAAICRQLVVLAIERNRQAKARVDVVVGLAEPIRPPRTASRRRIFGRVLATAVIGPLMIAGMLERTWTWALAAAVFLAVGLLRSELVPRRLHGVWAGVVERLPLLVRILGIVVLVRVVAGFMAGSVITSYESLAVFVLVTTLVSVLLLPPPAPGPGDEGATA